jgi:hypothetical protein
MGSSVSVLKKTSRVYINEEEVDGSKNGQEAVLQVDPKIY